VAIYRDEARSSSSLDAALEQEQSAAPDPSAPVSFGPESVVALQRTIGNAEVSRLLAGSQPAGAALQRQSKPEIEATDTVMGQRVVDSLLKMNGPRTAKSGVHYAHNYARLAKTNGDAKALWKEDYWSGYASPLFFERTDYMTWKLRPLKSAALAIKAWLAGPTIAECYTALIAIELDTMRAAVGDKRFDELFSSRPGKPAEKGLLYLGPADSSADTRESSVDEYMVGTDESLVNVPETPGHRTVKKGEWYYFRNHPKYVLKHPTGVFQGENAICMDATPGAQKYSGLGVGVLLESEMLDEMAQAYNQPRTKRDLAAVRAMGPKQRAQYNAKNFPDQVDAKAILDAPEFEFEGRKLKGGFKHGSGKVLYADKVRSERK